MVAVAVVEIAVLVGMVEFCFNAFSLKICKQSVY